MLTIFTIAFMIVPSMMSVGQSASVEWRPDNISIEDREAILELSRQMGMEQPRKVSFVQVEPMSTPCRFVLVESSVTDEGNHRIWFELHLRPPKSSQCLRSPLGASTSKVGQWIALSTGLNKREEWRIRDNEWHIDIPLGPEIPYSDAELVVLAIRRGELRNRLSNSKLPEINADTITAVQKGTGGVRTYVVRTGKENGFILEIRISNSDVELYSYSTWGVER